MIHLLLIALATVSLGAADATGKWSGTLTPSGQETSSPAHLVLKQQGEKLTGSGGASPDEQYPIDKGTAVSGKLTFEVTTPNGAVMKFNLTQDGNQITGDVSRERDGRTDTAKLSVKRAD